MARDLYSEVTNQIITAIESGVAPWRKSWHVHGSIRGLTIPKRHNGQSYNGVNVMLLWLASQSKGYKANTWMTYKQAQALGGNVRKGEKASRVVFFKPVTSTKTNAQGEQEEKRGAILREYCVFNVEQIDDLPAQYYPQDSAQPQEEKRIESAEEIFAATGAKINHGGDRAFYAPSLDVIQLPPSQAFNSAEHYTATKAHELIHWTGHETRCARQFGARFGDDAYAAEELVAELGAAFLCAELGIVNHTRDDHAAYLDAWLRVLKADKRAIFTAANKATEAMQYITKIATQEETEE